MPQPQQRLSVFSASSPPEVRARLDAGSVPERFKAKVSSVERLLPRVLAALEVEIATSSVST
jgi:hypothetical protein